jgi:hypothetical protein
MYGIVATMSAFCVTRLTACVMKRSSCGLTVVEDRCPNNDIGPELPIMNISKPRASAHAAIGES